MGTAAKVTKREVVLKLLKNCIFITLGVFIVAFALESFLIPNSVIDGGIIGISMILSYLTKWNLGIIVVLLNLPFILLAYKKMGIKFVIKTIYACVVLALALNIFAKYTVTEESFLATIFGGIILGVGVGFILKNEASLDGTEILSLSIAKKFGCSVGEFIMGINLFIYFAAGKVFGWESAMYSILTYFVASKVIAIVLEGFDSSKSVRIISDEAGTIGNSLIEKLDISVTYLKGIGGYTGQDKDLIYCVVSRLEMPKMLEIIKEIDSNAFVSVVDVHEAYGGRFRKKIDKI